jgi:hypothetical protein
MQQHFIIFLGMVRKGGRHLAELRYFKRWPPIRLEPVPVFEPCLFLSLIFLCCSQFRVKREITTEAHSARRRQASCGLSIE